MLLIRFKSNIFVSWDKKKKFCFFYLLKNCQQQIVSYDIIGKKKKSYLLFKISHMQLLPIN